MRPRSRAPPQDRRQKTAAMTEPRTAPSARTSDSALGARRAGAPPSQDQSDQRATSGNRRKMPIASVSWLPSRNLKTHPHW